MADLPKCRNCRKKFSSFPLGAPDHFPLILRCGHTFCKRCITKWANGRKKMIVCPICEMETKCQNGKESVSRLWPNVYMAGVMVCGSELPSLSHYFANSVHATRSKTPADRRKTGHKCSECVTVPATCRCVQCLADMCGKCFVSVHSNSRLLQQHQSVPLKTSLIDTECEKHHRLLEFFCENDKCPICPECMLSPEHRNHHIIQTVKKYEGLEKELKTAQTAAYCALQYCTRAKSELEGEIHKIKHAAFQQAERIHQHMLDYVGMIQAHFLGLTKELHDSAELCSGELVVLLEEIESKETLIREACEDTDLVLSNETKSQVVVNPEKLLETLRMANSLPCSLLARKETIHSGSAEDFTEVCSSANIDFGFTLNPGLPAFIRKFGDIEITGEVEYKLVPISEKPELLEQARPKNSGEVEKKTPTVRQIQEPPTKSQELVHVTFMESPTSFRVQRWADKSHIEAIERCLKAFKTRKPSLEDMITTVAIGELCAAFYEPTRTWYRASVTRKICREGVEDLQEQCKPQKGFSGMKSAKCQDVVEVLYVDYGDTGRTTVSCLRRLPENLKTVPELSIPCMLSNICPSDNSDEWPNETVSYFSKVVANRPLLMTTNKRERGCRIVDLHRPAADEIDADVPMSIRDALVFLGLAKFQCPVQAPGPTPAVSKKFLTPSLLPLNSLVSVTISYLQGPGSFLVQQMDSNIKYLAQLMKRIQVWVSKQLTGKDACAFNDGVHYLQIICPKEGMVCLAIYPSDEHWYRAQITGVNDDRTVEVKYVDYGDSATVHFVQLLKIPEMFTRLPIQALPCELHGISPLPGEENFSPVCQSRFSALCSDSELIMEVRAIRNDHYVVDLFDSMDEDPSLVSVTDRLYREGLVKVEKHEAKPILESELPVSGDTEQKESNEVNDQHSPESSEKSSSSKVNARVTRVISPDLFYVQTELQTSELNKMMMELQKEVEEKGEELSRADLASWAEGAHCIVKSKMEKRWCRAKLEVLDRKAETCKVILKDFGWLEQFPLTHLLRLPEKYATSEAFLTKCALGSVRPAGGSDKWTLGAIDRFEALVGGEDCLMEAHGDLSENAALVVDVWISEEPCDGATLTTENCIKVSRILAMDGLALPVRHPQMHSNVARSARTIDGSCGSGVSESQESLLPQAQSCLPKQLGSENADGERVHNSQLRPNMQDDQEGTEQLDITNTKAKDSNVEDEKEAEMLVSGTDPRSFIHFSRLPVGEYIQCHVTHVHDYETVYFRIRPVDCKCEENPVQDEINLWNLMMSQVQEVERNYLAVLEEEDIAVGRPCLSQYEDDKLWHRAIILSTQPMPEGVLVQYIDFGTLEQVPLGRLRQIPPAVCEIPVQAYLCRLPDADATTDEHSIETLLAEVAHKLHRDDLVVKVHKVCEPPPEKKHFMVMYQASFYCVDQDGFLCDVLE